MCIMEGLVHRIQMLHLMKIRREYIAEKREGIKLGDKITKLFMKLLLLTFLLASTNCNKLQNTSKIMKSYPNAVYHGGTDGGYYGILPACLSPKAFF